MATNVHEDELTTIKDNLKQVIAFQAINSSGWTKDWQNLLLQSYEDQSELSDKDVASQLISLLAEVDRQCLFHLSANNFAQLVRFIRQIESSNQYQPEGADDPIDESVAQIVTSCVGTYRQCVRDCINSLQQPVRDNQAIFHTTKAVLWRRLKEQIENGDSPQLTGDLPNLSAQHLNELYAHLWNYCCQLKEQLVERVTEQVRREASDMSSINRLVDLKKVPKSVGVHLTASLREYFIDHDTLE